MGLQEHHAATPDTPTDQGKPGGDYVSPGLARVEQRPGRRSTVRHILEAPVEPAAPDAERLAALEAQVERLEHQQRAFVDNLYEAHRAFALLAERVEAPAAARGQPGRGIEQPEPTRQEPAPSAPPCRPARVAREHCWWRIRRPRRSRPGPGPVW